MGWVDHRVVSLQPSPDPTCWALCPSRKLNLANFSHLSLQDMTDYVAYVAKDPINQRGELRGAQGSGPGAELCWRSQVH